VLSLWILPSEDGTRGCSPGYSADCKRWAGQGQLNSPSDQNVGGFRVPAEPSHCVRAGRHYFEAIRVGERGYARLRRTWADGDVVTLTMPMPVERVRAHSAVQQDAGCIALQRGPVVYCLEAVDNDVPLHRLLLPEDGRIDATFESELLGGVTVLRCAAWAEESNPAGAPLYGTSPARRVAASITAIPYYAWDNRKGGSMRVWLPALMPRGKTPVT